MADNWYYVQKGQRLGPVDASVVASLVAKNELRPDDFVWKKGFENWRKLQDVEELRNLGQAPAAPPKHVPEVALPAATQVPSLAQIPSDKKCIYLRIGVDRGGAPTEYGPYAPSMLKKLYTENRINGRTQFFIRENMSEWAFLADLPDFEEVFSDVPPVIQERERRTHVRKPMLARLFVQNNKKVYEGVCRDISIGGMQVLTDGFPGRAGDRIAINVHPDNTEHHFTAEGHVVRTLEGDSGFSFRFEGLQPEALRAIEKYIANVDQSN